MNSGSDLAVVGSFGGTARGRDQTVTDPTPLTTFNQVIFSTSQSEADYVLDNVTVNFTPSGN